MLLHPVIFKLILLLVLKIQALKARLKEVSGQPYVLDNGYLFVFVLDYYRHHLVDEVAASNMETSYGSAEGLLVGTIDVALVAQKHGSCCRRYGVWNCLFRVIA